MVTSHCTHNAEMVVVSNFRHKEETFLKRIQQFSTKDRMKMNHCLSFKATGCIVLSEDISDRD